MDIEKLATRTAEILDKHYDPLEYERAFYQAKGKDYSLQQIKRAESDAIKAVIDEEDQEINRYRNSIKKLQELEEESENVREFEVFGRIKDFIRNFGAPIQNRIDNREEEKKLMALVSYRNNTVPLKIFSERLQNIICTHCDRIFPNWTGERICIELEFYK